MDKVQISNRQLWFIIFMIRSTVVLSNLPVLTSADALQDAWLSALITLFGSEIFVILIAFIDSRFPNLSLVGYSQKLLGKWPGRLLSLAILFLFLELTVVNLRIYAEVIINGFLPETPMWFIAGAMVLNAAYCVHKGIETLGRTSDLLFFIFMFSVIALVLIPLPEVNIQNIQPVLARGWKPVIRGALTPIGLITQVWVLVMLGDDINRPQKLVSTAVTSVGASIIALSIVSFIVVAVLGPYQGASSAFPALTLLRSVQLSDFLQRTEVLLIVAWGLGVFVSLSTYLYCGAKGLAQLFNLKKHNYLLIPMSFIWVYLTINFFDNMFELYAFLKPEVYVPYSYSFLIIPLILLYGGYGLKLLKDKIRGEKGDT